MAAGDRYNQRLDQAVSLLENALPHDPADPVGFPISQQLSPHAETATRLLPDHRVERGLKLLGKFGHMHWSAGRTNEAIALEELVLAQRVEVLGDTHPDTLTSRNNLASSYQSAGRTNEAIALKEQVLAQRVEVLGDTHPDTLTSRNNLEVMWEDGNA